MVRALKTRIKHFISPKYKYLGQFAVKKGDIVIDLGANVGEVVEYFLAKGAQVHAYEPNPSAFAILLRRTRGQKNAHLHPVAVSDFIGKSKLWLHENHTRSEIDYSQGSSLQPGKDNVGEDFIEVDVANIRDILKPHAHIRLLKIDIEGGEYDIIDGVLENMAKIGVVVLETHEKKGREFAEKHEALLEKIKNSGYENKFFLDWF